MVAHAAGKHTSGEWGERGYSWPAEMCRGDLIGRMGGEMHVDPLLTVSMSEARPHLPRGCALLSFPLALPGAVGGVREIC